MNTRAYCNLLFVVDAISLKKKSRLYRGRKMYRRKTRDKHISRMCVCVQQVAEISRYQQKTTKCVRCVWDAHSLLSLVTCIHIHTHPTAVFYSPHANGRRVNIPIGFVSVHSPPPQGVRAFLRTFISEDIVILLLRLTLFTRKLNFRLTKK